MDNNKRDFAAVLKAQLSEAIAKHKNYKVLTKPTKVAERINIRCPKHGIFSQVFRSFITSEIPCAKCRADARRVTTDDFLVRAKKKHKIKFDYSNTLYVDGQTKVTIRCLKHGDFDILPHVHLRGAGGCKGCKTGKLSQKEFIDKSKKLFPRRYDYNATVFDGTTKEVTIICKKKGHGAFTQLAGNHLTGREGCHKCARLNAGRPEEQSSVSARTAQRGSELIARRISQKEFERRARKKHKNRYDLSEAVYETQSDPVRVICKSHGPFQIAPHNLWRGGNCPKCAKAEAGNAHRLNPIVFLERARLKHGNKYDLSQVKYTVAKAKIKPICKIHGPFTVLPANFLRGTGCPKCASSTQITTMNAAAMRKNIVNDFIAVHGDKYDYSKVKYQGICAKVTIICNQHGPFEQSPRNHLDDKGCPQCGNQARTEAQRLTQSEVLARFKEIHGERFDYSKFHYKDSKTKSTIICREVGHGPFQMNAQAHFNEQACPRCAEPKGERRISKWLSEHSIEHVPQFGILPKGKESDRYRLRYDFLLPAHNILIEFDGEQHYRPVRFHGISEEKSKEIFAITKKRDRAKNKWAKQNGYQLLRIRFDANTIQMLEETLLQQEI